MRRATEAECQQAIIEAAKTGGWLVHAERAAKSSKGWATPIQGDAGWPDLVLLHPRRDLCIFAFTHPTHAGKRSSMPLMFCAIGLTPAVGLTRLAESGVHRGCLMRKVGAEW